MRNDPKPEYEPPTITDLGEVTEITRGNKGLSQPDNQFGIPIGS